MFGDLSLLFLRAKARCTEREGFMLTDLSLQTYIIFMSVLLSSAAAGCLTFNFHSHYWVEGLYLYDPLHPHTSAHNSYY